MKQVFYSAVIILVLLSSCKRRAQYTCNCEDGYRGNRFYGNSKAGAKASEECKVYKQATDIDTLECYTVVLD